MSYSRWSSSCWYTYADAGGGFTIFGEKNFSNEELKDIDKCCEMFKGSYTDAEIEELKGYMRRYLADHGDKE